MLSAENMCMLNGKTRFTIQNIPEDAVLVRFNPLFAYVYDAVSGGKGMMQLKIDPAKTRTIANIAREHFPAIKCFDNEKLHLLNPRTIAYIHALMIDSISMLFEESINARALEHEKTMLDDYSSMNPDAFMSQLQAVLSTYFEDIKGVHGASGCPKPKIVKRRYVDPDDAGATPDEDAVNDATAPLDAAAAQAEGAAAAAAPAGGEAAAAAAAPAGGEAAAALVPAAAASPAEKAGRGGKKAKNNCC